MSLSFPPSLTSPFYPLARRPAMAAPGWPTQTSPGAPVAWPAHPAAITLRNDAGRQDAVRLKEEGNAFRRQRLYPQAISAYQRAVQADPSYTDGYYNLAKTYHLTGNLPAAIATFETLLSRDPRDHDARVTLGEYLEEDGKPLAALAQYESVIGQAAAFDPARRNRLLLENKLLAGTDPERAAADFIAQAQATLGQAIDIANRYLSLQEESDPPPLLQHNAFEFAPTEVVQDAKNLAEYDHYKKLIRITPALAYAQPVVLAAYLIHELIHAQDQDAISSIQEEQDAYLALARFWHAHRGDWIDPNLDLAAALYAQSESLLKAKVRELYTGRDPLILEQSPGHGLPPQRPDTQNAATLANAPELIRPAASLQPLRFELEPANRAHRIIALG